MQENMAQIGINAEGYVVMKLPGDPTGEVAGARIELTPEQARLLAESLLSRAQLVEDRSTEDTDPAIDLDEDNP